MECCGYGCPHSGCVHEAVLIARARAHAALAQAAAVLFPFQVPTPTEAEWKEWLRAMTPA